MDQTRFDYRPTMSFVLRFLLFLFLLSGLMPARAELVAVPVLSARVTDLTGTLDGAQKAALEEKLATFEKAKGSQVAVLMVPRTQPEAIEQFSMRVAEAWKIGRKGQDDGVILLVAKDERKLRIEVGRGLEGALPDAVCKRIIAEDIAPRFKAGDWAGGLNAGVDRIHNAISGEALPPPEPGAAEGTIPGGDGEIAGIVAAVVLGNLLGRFVGRLPAGLLSGAVVGYLVMLLSGSLLAAGLFGFFAFLFVLVPSTGSDFWIGGSGGGGSSGSSSSDSGWSGGGGDFGGGGASGDW